MLASRAETMHDTLLFAAIYIKLLNNNKILYYYYYYYYYYYSSLGVFILNLQGDQVQICNMVQLA